MRGKDMTTKELVYHAFEGKSLKRNPVTVPYNILICEDHFTELTGEPVWKFYETMLNPECAAKYYHSFAQKIPFDIFETYRWQRGRDTNEFREKTEVVVNEKGVFYHNKYDDSYEKLPENPYDFDNKPTERQIVFDKHDVKEQVACRTAEVLLRTGFAMHTQECVKEFGNEKFILSGRVLNVLYQSSWYVGLTNLYYMIGDEDPLLEYLQKTLLEANLEKIRAYAACGGDAIHIDDAMAGSDMISASSYEQYSLPYMQRQIEEIHRLGKKAIVTYFGGVEDRIEQIISTGADALVMECSMKNFVNDYGKLADIIDDRLCLYTNIDPIAHVRDMTEQQLKETISEYVRKARKHKKYMISTGSPLTPDTSWERIRFFADAAKQ